MTGATFQANTAMRIAAITTTPHAELFSATLEAAMASASIAAVSTIVWAHAGVDLALLFTRSYSHLRSGERSLRPRPLSALGSNEGPVEIEHLIAQPDPRPGVPTTASPSAARQRLSLQADLSPVVQ